MSFGEWTIRHNRRYWSQLLVTAGGATSLNVNGSLAVPIVFSFPAPDTAAPYEFFVTHIILTIVDNSIDLTGFGNLAALANGISLVLNQKGESTTIILQANGKTLGAIIKAVNPGNEDSHELIPNIQSITHDAIRIRINISDPHGLWFENGSNSSIVATVNDNLTGLTDFTIRLFGYKD